VSAKCYVSCGESRRESPDAGADAGGGGGGAAWRGRPGHRARFRPTPGPGSLGFSCSEKAYQHTIPLPTQTCAIEDRRRFCHAFLYGPRGRGLGTRFSFRLSIQKLAPGPGQRKPRTPPTDASHAAGRVGGRRRPAAERRTAGPASVRGSLCGLRTRTRRGGNDGGARRVETRWRGAARRDNRAIVASPSYSRTPSHIALQCADASCCYRARRSGVGDAGGIEPACADAPDGAPPPWGTQRRTRHRRMTTVSSTSGGFHRRRRLFRGRHAAGRGTIFGAGCAAQRAASAPSPPHLHSTRAHSAPSIRAAGTSWPELESPSAAPP
jgi:hypothetical protein